MKISDRLRREVANFGPVAQDDCPDILTEAADEIDDMQKRLDRWEPKIGVASAHGLSQSTSVQK